MGFKDRRDVLELSLLTFRKKLSQELMARFPCSSLSAAKSLELMDAVRLGVEVWSYLQRWFSTEHL